MEKEIKNCSQSFPKADLTSSKERIAYLEDENEMFRKHDKYAKKLSSNIVMQAEIDRLKEALEWAKANSKEQNIRLGLAAFKNEIRIKSESTKGESI